MGIPAYFSYIIKHNSRVLQSIHSTNIHHLLLDSNSIIYDCIKDHTEKEIIQEVCKKLDYYIHLFKPSKSVYIAFDGVAPAAKLKQQRERRIKGYYIKQLTKTNEYSEGFNIFWNKYLKIKKRASSQSKKLAWEQYQKIEPT